MAILSPALGAAMGRVDTALTIANAADVDRAQAGEIEAAAIRSVSLDSVLVDTGATYLSLPAGLVARLGLHRERDLIIGTAAGPQPAGLYRGALLEVLGRRATVDVLELPDNVPALLGVIPLEALGIEPDVRHRQLRLLPEDENDTYVTAM